MRFSWRKGGGGGWCRGGPERESAVGRRGKGSGSARVGVPPVCALAFVGAPFREARRRGAKEALDAEPARRRALTWLRGAARAAPPAAAAPADGEEGGEESAGGSARDDSGGGDGGGWHSDESARCVRRRHQQLAVGITQQRGRGAHRRRVDMHLEAWR